MQMICQHWNSTMLVRFPPWDVYHLAKSFNQEILGCSYSYLNMLVDVSGQISFIKFYVLYLLVIRITIKFHSYWKDFLFPVF